MGKKKKRKKERNQREKGTKKIRQEAEDIIKFARPGNWTGARYRRCVASFPRRSCSARAKITSQQLSCSSRNCRRLVSRTGLAQHCSYWVLCFVFVLFFSVGYDSGAVAQRWPPSVDSVEQITWPSSSDWFDWAEKKIEKERADQGGIERRSQSPQILFTVFRVAGCVSVLFFGVNG